MIRARRVRTPARGVGSFVIRTGIGLGVVLGLLAGADPAFAASTCRWIGTGGGNTWSTTTNWADCGGGLPHNGDSIQFLNGAATAASVNDIPDLSLAGILLSGRSNTGADWDINGNPIALTGNLTAQDIPIQTNVRMTITVGVQGLVVQNLSATPGRFAPLVLGDINLNGFRLTFSSFFPIFVHGTISGAAPSAIRVIGGPTAPSLFQLDQDNTYQGSTTIEDTRVLVFTATPFGPTTNDVVLNDGSQLLLGVQTALANSLRVNGTVTVIAGGEDSLSGTIFAGPTAGLNFNTELAGRLTLTGHIGSDAGPQLTKLGTGTLVLANSHANKDAWTNLLIQGGTVRIGADNVIPDSATVLIQAGTLDVGAFDETIGTLGGNAAATIQLALGTLAINQTGLGAFAGTITGNGSIIKNGAGELQLRAPTTHTAGTRVNAGVLALRSPTGHAIVGPLIVTGGSVQTAAGLDANQLGDLVTVTLDGGNLTLANPQTSMGTLGGNGTIALDGVLAIGTANVLSTFNGTISGTGRVVKTGTSILTLTGANTYAATTVTSGTLWINGSLRPTGIVTVTGGILGGTGTVGPIEATGGTISAGLGPSVLHAASPAILHAGAATLNGATFVVELNGSLPGTGYDQLALTGNLTLAGAATLQATLAIEPRQGAGFTIIDVPAGKTVTGTFNGLPEGATLPIGDRHFTISYHGGDGNDVVLTAADAPPAVTYYLSEGATGGFFDEDVLIANPNDTAAPVTLTFSKENGEQVVSQQTVPAQAHVTVHVDQIPGLEATSASAQVTSEAGWPLVVERSMFWDKTYYAGHTGSAVDTPAPDWFFAEGSQGFFDTFVLVINPNATSTDVTFTFFRENEPAVVKTVTVGATTRLTLHAGDVPDLVNRSFGIAVHATQPIMAERSMYFGTTPTRLWSGGHESAGVTAASRHWFLAEGATGGFFDTFILLSNPQSTQAQVLLTYLLDTGEKVEVPKTIPANTRLTTNIEAEDDPRLHNAAVSTVVEADQPIIAERSMYWPGAAVPWGEGHNSFGVIAAGTRWGLSEGRTGGPLAFHTYILLANPQTTAAEVTVSYLRESGAPVVKTYTVPATSRFNIDTGTVTELHDESFGAVIAVTNNVPIIVERSMYWDSNGFLFSGGTNATGIRLNP